MHKDSEDSTISMEELVRAMGLPDMTEAIGLVQHNFQLTGIPTTDAALIMAQCDANGDGEISVMEFLSGFGGTMKNVQEHRAAQSIQAHYRGYQARKSYGQVKEQTHAATKIQANFRGHQARKDYQQRLSAQATSNAPNTFLPPPPPPTTTTTATTAPPPPMSPPPPPPPPPPPANSADAGNDGSEGAG